MPSRISLLRANRKRVRDAAMFFVAAELSRRNFGIDGSGTSPART